LTTTCSANKEILQRCGAQMSIGYFPVPRRAEYGVTRVCAKGYGEGVGSHATSAAADISRSPFPFAGAHGSCRDEAEARHCGYYTL
jgi:hypothetical protein